MLSEYGQLVQATSISECTDPRISTRDCCPAEEDKHSSDGAQEVTLPKFDFKPPRYRQMSISAVDACGGTPLPTFRFSFNSTDPPQEQKLIPSPHAVIENAYHRAREKAFTDCAGQAS